MQGSISLLQQESWGQEAVCWVTGASLKSCLEVTPAAGGDCSEDDEGKRCRWAVSCREEAAGTGRASSLTRHYI